MDGAHEIAPGHPSLILSSPGCGRRGRPRRFESASPI